VNWLRRGRQPSPPSGLEAREALPEVVEASAPGVALLLDGVRDDGSHAVLDLGPASSSSLAVYRRYSRRVRFADVPGHAASWRGDLVAGLARALPAQPDQPYGLVFGWDTLDRLLPEYHAPLIDRLAGVTAPDARLHMVVWGETTERPHRFALLDLERMSYERGGPHRPAAPRLLPAQVAHLLEPFHVVRGITLKGGLREYVALRQPA
jgi:hypothetical protein